MFDHLDDPAPHLRPDPDLPRAVARGRALRRRRTAVLSAAGALLLVAAAGTGVAVLRQDDGDSSLLPADPGPAVTSQGPVPTVSPPAIAPGTPPSATPSPTAAGEPYCASSQLTIGVGGPGDAAAGTRSTYLLFTNDGSAPCLLNGHPGVSYVAGDDGHQVGQPADRDGATQRVTLAPGAVAHARLLTASYQSYDPAACQPTAVTGYRVYPPDQIAAAFVPAPATACASTGISLMRIGAVLPGIPTEAGAP